MFIDTHCHLTDRHCNDGDADRAIENAMAAGVGVLVCPTADPDDIPGALHLAHMHRNVFCTIGIHPEYINANPEQYLTDDILQDERVVGVGEIGLDYHYSPDTRMQQIEMFKRQLEIAKLLIEKGADVNAKDYYGKDPLHYAIRNKASPEIINFLKEKGAKE